MVGTVKCPVCRQQCIPRYGSILWGASMGWHHDEEGCWWEDGITAKNSKPSPISLWQRIKKHGWNARIF